MERILNVRFDNLTLEDILEFTKKVIDTRKKLHIITLNTEMIMLAQEDLEFRQVIEKAGLVVPESSGLQIAWQHQNSKSGNLFSVLKSGFKTLTGFRLKDPIEVIPGVDLTIFLVGMASEFGYKVFLLGGEEGVAEKAKDYLLKLFPNLNVRFFSGGDIDSANNNEAVRRINAFQPDILLVAFGAPKQEKWITANLVRLRTHVAIGVGGTFDFFSGKVSRAPKIVRNLGLEWVYRLGRQPWRVKRQASLFKFLMELTKRKGLKPKD